MFERAPFEECPKCRAPGSFGILSAGGSTLQRRCKTCRYGHSEVLPDLDKKVVYLDQFAVSEIFKVKAGTRNAAAGGQAFWEEVEARANRAYLLQQVIFPTSDIHRDETIVSPFGNELGLAHEMLSGDVSFNSVNEIELFQALAYAEAYLQGKLAPDLNFDVGEILEGKRNDWLPDMHVTASMDYGIFAEELRNRREEATSNFAPLWQRWLRDKPSFGDVLNHELTDYANAKRGALRRAAERAQAALKAGNGSGFVDKMSHPALNEFNHLKTLFKKTGFAPDQLTSKVYEFWDWPENQKMPFHRISSYLFAALARRLASGQKRLPSRGMMNDVNAISAYGPFVDAMFLDKECASLLTEEPLRSQVKLKAKIFSTTTGDAFVEYLRQLELQAPDDVRERASEIYGV
jgi:hypothetical protein